MNNILSKEPEKMSNNRKNSNYQCSMAIVAVIILLLACQTLAADMPSLIKKHYRGHDSIYWKIRQITYSPVFEQSETLAVEFYVERTIKLFILMPDRQIYSYG